MGFFSRLLGRCTTPLLQDGTAWSFQDGTLSVDLSKVGALEAEGSAVRLEADGLPERVLIVHGTDDGWHAFRNKCTHGGRRVDPLPGTAHVECCSVGKSTFDYAGQLVSGSAKDPIHRFPTQRVDDRLVVELSS